MALARVSPSGGQVWDYPSFPASTTLTMPATSPPPGVVNVGDELVLVVAQYFIGTGPTMLPISGWTQIGSTPQDGATGSGGQTVRVDRIFKRRADGVDDTPTITVRNTASAARDVMVHAVQYRYTGGKLSVVDSGSVGNTGVGPPTLPESVTSPPNGVFISTAYQTRTYLTPALTVGNGFDLMYAHSPGASTQPIGLGVADFFLADGDTDLPQWNVSRGNSETQHHHAWVLLKIDDDVVSAIRLAGLTWGTKRKRLGRPGVTP